MKKKLNNFIIYFCIGIILISGLVLVYINNENNYMYKGEYEEAILNLDRENSLSNSYIIINNFSDFKEFIEDNELDDNRINEIELEKYNYNFFRDKSILIVNTFETYALHSVSEKNNVVNIEKWSYMTTGTTLLPKIFIIPVSKNITTANIENYCNNQTEIEIGVHISLAISVSILIYSISIKKVKRTNNRVILIICIIIINILILMGRVVYYNLNETIDKPVIYLYPEEEMKISVRLENKENITCSYPEYKEGWNVFAKPDGSLVDLDTGRNLYSLYYECESMIEFNVEEDGFVVASEDIVSFLEEKLEILGLNEIEAEEFIIYWLPKLKQNKYNYIKFVEIDEINRNMPLEVTGNPDTVIRILMKFKGLERPIEVEEQKIEKVERKGYTVVEWGGTEIK